MQATLDFQPLKTIADQFTTAVYKDFPSDDPIWRKIQNQNRTPASLEAAALLNTLRPDLVKDEDALQLSNNALIAMMTEMGMDFLKGCIPQSARNQETAEAFSNAGLSNWAELCTPSTP